MEDNIFRNVVEDINGWRQYLEECLNITVMRMKYQKAELLKNYMTNRSTFLKAVNQEFQAWHLSKIRRVHCHVQWAVCQHYQLVSLMTNVVFYFLGIFAHFPSSFVNNCHLRFCLMTTYICVSDLGFVSRFQFSFRPCSFFPRI